MNLPAWMKRATKRARRGLGLRGFQAAKTSRLLSPWKIAAGFTSQEIRNSLSMVRGRSRDMAENSPQFKRWLDLRETNIVGEGFSLKSTPHDGTPGSASWKLDENAARFIEYHWKQWCKNPMYCDFAGRKTMAEIDRLNAKTHARDGEYFALPVASSNPYGLSLRIIRPDTCDEQYCTDLGAAYDGRIVENGVEMDPVDRKPTAYWFKSGRGKDGTLTNRGPMARITAIFEDGPWMGEKKVIHGYTQEDESQTRGIPLGHAALVTLKMLDLYNEAEVVAARDEACSVRTYFAPRGDDGEIADLTTDENSDVTNALTAEKEPGQAEVLPLGWDTKVHTPQHPNRELTAFKASLLKDTASGFGVEYSNYANDWGGVSFSSVRVGTISERDLWIVQQNNMIAQSKTPVFRIWLKAFLSMPISGALPVSKYDKFVEHEFRGRRWMWVDPMRDMAAAVIAESKGWKTNTQITEDMGGDFDDNVEEIKRETVTIDGTVLERQPEAQSSTSRALQLVRSVEDAERLDNENEKQEEKSA